MPRPLLTLLSLTLVSLATSPFGHASDSIDDLIGKVFQTNRRSAAEERQPASAPEVPFLSESDIDQLVEIIKEVPQNLIAEKFLARVVGKALAADAMLLREALKPREVADGTVNLNAWRSRCESFIGEEMARRQAIETLLLSQMQREAIIRSSNDRFQVASVSQQMRETDRYVQSLMADSRQNDPTFGWCQQMLKALPQRSGPVRPERVPQESNRYGYQGQ